MKKLFGTDGVRGKAGEFLDAATAMRLALSMGVYFKQSSSKQTGKILLGKDTRRSGYMIENAIVAGLTSVGYDVVQIGPMPTPAIAYLTQSMRCDAGIMLSASHNPFYDNGLKFFNCNGDKLSEQEEKQIEEIYFDEKNHKTYHKTGKGIGKAKRIDDVIGRYIVSIKSSFPVDKTLYGIKVVLDCANGAGYKVGPTILSELDANLIVINDKPNGYNINDNCGALYPQNLGKAVLKHKADIGIALDGDADRLVVVDEKGQTIDGDKLIATIATSLKAQNKLQNNRCVVTVMSNMATENYLQSQDIEVFRTDVGDRFVLAKMKEIKSNFGAEQSGHIILKDISKTGDGLASALYVLSILCQSDEKASKLFNPFDLSSQLLVSLIIKKKLPLQEIVGLDNLKQKLKDKGLRELIRYSGTENKIRLLIEGADEAIVKKSMNELETFIKKTLCD
ncbi:MAG: phosphoglucosamine mutase [Epsilonproteobacteria bacterium]|nr:MAG: phosphoglucosamine mutase [Campylobacterota bacterium]